LSNGLDMVLHGSTVPSVSVIYFEVSRRINISIDRLRFILSNILRTG
jgi:hypothetical protein